MATSTVSPAPHPRVAVAGAEGDAAAHDLFGRDAGFEQPEHRLRQHQGEPHLEAVVEPLEEVLDRVVAAARLDEHVVSVDGHLRSRGRRRQTGRGCSR